MSLLYRGPDAKLRLARRLADEWLDVDPKEYGDPQLTGYARFLFELRQLGALAQERHAARNPEMAEVHYMVSTSSAAESVLFRPVEEGMSRAATTNKAAQRDAALTKALILCDADPADISAQLGLMVRSVRTFEALAFDVRNRLADRGYILNHVIGCSLTEAVNAHDFESQILIEAYENGRQGIDDMLGLSVSNADESMSRIRKARELALARKARTATSVLQVQGYNALEVVNSDASLRKTEADIENRMVGGSGPTDGMKQRTRENVVGLLSGVGIGVSNALGDEEVAEGDEYEDSCSNAFDAALMEYLEARNEPEQKG